MGGDDGVGFDVHGFGFGLLADAGEGGFVLLFLEGARHVTFLFLFFGRGGVVAGLGREE